MAENQDERSREDLTEEASPYRIEEFRQKGIVSQSRELSSLAALIAAAAAVYVYAPSMGRQILEFMQDVFRTDLTARADLGSGNALREHMIKCLYVMASLGLPISLAGFFLGVLSSFAQVGSVFSMGPLTPDASRIDPIQGLKRMFAGRHLLDGLRITLKVVAVLLITYLLVKVEIFESPRHTSIDTTAILQAFSASGKAIFLALFAVLGVFGVIDFGLQRWEFSKQLRMTKQEAKQEHKEREGDPQIKARIRSVQREMARRRMMAAVKKADVVVTNPTHIAVALLYEKSKMAAPRVVAKGADFLAQKIKKIAADAGVPMVENVPLARTLYKSVKVGQFIPRALYQAVAEVLAYVYRLKNRTR
jgi:flagellar biosynthesis protein FlhB